ncbi:MAG: NAD(+)/NADH kinase [Candidatus Aenigmarchaeota archaeon]|nr:NAD(+)/NADH kinase [Candidatus Aenigmarchaeota archaeon]
MRFIILHKKGYGEKLRDEIAAFLERNGADWTERIEKADFALSIGGDGTLMRDHYKLKCPVLGINPANSIGYYIRADKHDYKERLLAMMNGKEGRDYYVYELMRLSAKLNGKKMEALALNDILVSPVYVRRMLETRLSLDSGTGVERNSGILVYTPTGSHAFAHSAGASKMKYDCDRMGVTALAPYSGTLKQREITVAKGDVKIECLSPEGEVCIDGSETNLRKIGRGDVVEVSKSSSPLKLVGFRKRFD